MHRLLVAKVRSTVRVFAGIAMTLVLAAAPTRMASPAAQERGASVDWPLHNFDAHGSRYAPLTQINPSNVAQLDVKWSAQPGANFGEQTPVVVDGLMYLNSGSKMFALNATTGELQWTFEGGVTFLGGGRGPTSGDGRVYAFGPSIIYAVEAKTGKLVESFGDKGLLHIVNKALDFKYAGKYPADLDPTKLGYSMTTPPLYANGTLYVGVPFADSLLPGGLLVAADGKTGAIKWVFNTVPQTPTDDGWEIAKDTWGSGERYGGGIWTTPSIDLELGLIYFNASNPSPNYDGSSRKGTNLFTESVIALNAATGKLAWYYQTLHHDIWDWDLVSGPLLFDRTTSSGRTIKGIASFGKTCYGYFLDRQTGKPINPIVESPVPTKTDVPGDEPWPTQPIPYTSSGVPQQPFCRTYPDVADPELLPLVRPSFHPYQVNEFVITSPGNLGGANYGPPSFSPKNGLIYITGKDDAFSIKVKPVGDTLKPGPGNQGHFAVLAATGKTGVTPAATLTAYDPVTGQQAWHTVLTGATNSGNLVTAGDLVFQSVGTTFYAFDATTGKQLFKYTAKSPVRSSPLTYQVNGTQYVAVVASNTVLSFALSGSQTR
jgi:glucose dehydrogenase